MTGKSGYWADHVFCPFPGCEHTCTRNNLIGHFRTQLHREHFADLTAATLRPMIEQAKRTDGQPDSPRVISTRPLKDTEPNQRTRKRQLSDTPQAQRKRRDRQYVSCPSCGSPQQRKNLRRHIAGQHAGSYSTQAISQLIRDLPEIAKTDPAARNLPAVLDVSRSARRVTVEPEPINLHQLDGTDIALGVVMSQVNGHLHADLLPDVVAYVDHTRQLITRIRAVR